jgi:salicylate hydroxylase
MSFLDPVAVAGAGIGGLAAALALGRSGASVHVYEKTSDFSEAGAGIGLGPNAVRVLQQWGVNTALQAQACGQQQDVGRCFAQALRSVA